MINDLACLGFADLGATARSQHQVGRAGRHPDRLTPRLTPPVWASRDPFHGRATVAAPSPTEPGQRQTGNAGERFIERWYLCRMPELRGTIVLATYNSGASVGPVLAEIEEAASVLRRSGIEIEVLVVDDSSPDNTAAIASDEAARLGIKLEVLTGAHLGLGGSQLAGFEHLLRTADRDFFVTLDPDGHHDARQITDVVRTFVARRSGVTIGSRWVRGGSSPGTSAVRSIVSRTANWLARRIIGLHGVHDATTSFRIIQPDVARLWIDRQIPADGYGYFTTSIAVAQAAGFSVTECPITFRPDMRACGPSRSATSPRSGKVCTPPGVLVAEVRDESRRDQATWAARSPRMQAQHASSNSQFGAAEELGEPRSGQQLLRVDRR